MATVVIFLVVTLTPAANTVAMRIAVPSRIEKSDAIVVLAGGLLRDGTLLDESMRRAMQGFALYKEGLAPLIVLSGRARLDRPTPTEAEVRAEFAQRFGIPSDAILTETTANTTREESVAIGRILQQRNVSRILLVTESLHLRRSMLVFERAGFQVLPAPSDDFSTSADSPGYRLWLFTRVMQEAAALAYYRAAGYL